MTWTRVLAVSLMVFLTGCVSRTVMDADSGFSDIPLHIEKTGELQHPELIEVSGMAYSHRRSNLIWLINDSGNPAVLYGIDEKGHHICRISLPQLENRDWEDLASYSTEEESWLVIGEIGDNKARYEQCHLYFIKEPKPKPDGSWPNSAPVSRTISFRYETGPRDVEGLAVDVQQNTIWLLSKRTTPPELYSLPLDAPDRVIAEAKKVTTFKGLKEASLGTKILAPKESAYLAQPTAMDFNRQSNLLAVMTYGHIYLYSGPFTEYPTPAVRYAPPRMRQAEALCFSSDGKALYFTSEKKPSPLYRLSLSSPHSTK